MRNRPSNPRSRYRSAKHFTRPDPAQHHVRICVSPSRHLFGPPAFQHLGSGRGEVPNLDGRQKMVELGQSGFPKLEAHILHHGLADLIKAHPCLKGKVANRPIDRLDVIHGEHGLGLLLGPYRVRADVRCIVAVADLPSPPSVGLGREGQTLVMLG